ncbi:MAG TPA: phenylalanine--tRNA ligase subunit beta, partial [Bacillota bacterium]|nr:phenylalanine--tRNA ligase subunit beta [Bacillota bacterium]
ETLFALADPSCKYTPLPKFPSMSRDFAMVVKEAVTVGALAAEIKASAGELLEDVKLFDVYRGAPVAPGFKSVAFSLTYRAKDRTLTEAEVNEINSGVLAALRAGHDAVLREM